jgi:hypothetical protein
VSDLLEGQGAELLHDLGRALHLLPFKRHQRSFGLKNTNKL